MCRPTNGAYRTPVAVVLDHLAGYNGFMDGCGHPGTHAGDREARDLFDFQLFPGSDHIHTAPNPENPEGSYLRPTPYGEIFDVLLTSASADTLSAYPVLLLAGDIEFNDTDISALGTALERGSRVLLSKQHREALGENFDELAGRATWK